MAVRRFIEAVRHLDSFVIASIQGAVDFQLFGLLLACDYRIASEGTVFVNRSLNLGVPPGSAVPWFLARSVGQAKAAQILLEQKSLTSKQALDLGLVDQIVHPPLLGAEALAAAD